MNLNEWRDMIADWGREKGWNELLIIPDQVGTKLFLVVEELVEAFEHIRLGHSPSAVYTSLDGNEARKPEGFGPEIADAIIRLLHLCALLGLDPEKLVTEKMAYNQQRAYRHGKTC